MVEFIKIPQECFKRSKDNNILNQVEFYYKLKMLSRNGYFEKGRVISTINKHIKQSDANIWKKIKELVQTGLCYNHSQGYRLVSYDKLFEKLGYDLVKSKNRRGTFKIHKVPTKLISDVRSTIAFVDLRENLNQQTNRAFYNLHKDKRYQYTEKNLHSATLKEKRSILNSVVKSNVRMIELNDEAITTQKLYEARSNKDMQQLFCNPDVTLSLKGVCRILGFSNTSSAHATIKRLQHYKMIEVEKRRIRIGSCALSYAEYLKDYSDLYIMEGNVLFRRLPNKISVVV